ncbi:DUF493 family protein [Salidesulfovibrio brasiliensis]|uniref:DUF493 family protein n=1 Tax=Salidesulfovibrio brasiliensis TaxID=221711 RepID=UPI0006CF7FAC|nr:DUF493 family protein [Salidesulfovibrio brasiliensis]
MTFDRDKFMETLDEHHEWPCPFIFKFIMPTESLPVFEERFPETEYSLKESKSGKYTSVTMEPHVCSAEEVVKVYEKAADIPGIMSL